MLVRRWWICRYSSVLSIGWGGSWSKTSHDRYAIGTCASLPCSGSVPQPTKSYLRKCFFGSGDGRGSVSYPRCVSTALEFGDGRWLRQVHKMLQMVCTSSIFSFLFAKFSEQLFSSHFFSRLCVPVTWLSVN
jgi:hypothetical protein